MVSGKTLLVLVLAAAAGLAAWRLAMPSDEHRIKKVFREASELLSKNGTEPVFAAASKARALAALVAPDAHLHIPERNLDFAVEGRDLDRQIAIARSQTQFINISFEDISVVFAADDTALVTADVLFKGTSDLLGFSGRDVRELAATMRRGSHGEWLFASIGIKPVVEK